MTSALLTYRVNCRVTRRVTWRCVVAQSSAERVTVAVSSAPTPYDEEPDELGELPPLDDDAHDSSHPPAEIDDLVAPEGEASLDDATGEDDPTDSETIDLDESDGGWLDEPTDSPSLDVGDAATVDFGDDGALGDDDEPASGVEDFGLGTSSERVDLDGGEEGPLDADEELREQDLPALDADEAGELDDAALIDAAFTSDEPAGLPWAAAPWERVGAPSPIARAVAVVCAGHGAVALGRSDTGTLELWGIDLEGASDTLEANGLDVTAAMAIVAGDGGRTGIVAVTTSGERFVSTDGGLTFVIEPSSKPMALSDIIVPWEASVPAVRAARGSHEAYAARHGGIVCRRSVSPWITHTWAGRVTAIVHLDDDGGLLAATYSDSDDTTALVHRDPTGVASVVARIGATRANHDSDGRVVSMAYDEPRGVVWLAGGFGVAAFAVR